MLIGIGAKGNEVKVIQRALVAKGFLAAGKDDGDFGPKTEAALRLWEKGKGDGKVSNDEYALLVAIVRTADPKYAALPPLPAPPPVPSFPAIDPNALAGYAAPVATTTTKPLPPVIADEAELIKLFGKPWENQEAWAAKNIGLAKLPVAFNHVFRKNVLACNRYIIPVVEATFADLAAKGLAPLITEYGGCWNVRQSRGASSWSKHTWGVAIDLNMKGNGLGEKPTLDPRIASVLRAHGWTWGGDWKRPDGMHSQYVRRG